MVVKLPNGSTMRRHVDQLKSRHTTDNQPQSMTTTDIENFSPTIPPTNFPTSVIPPSTTTLRRSTRNRNPINRYAHLLNN